MLRRNSGETDYLEFNADWPALPRAARQVLALDEQRNTNDSCVSDLLREQ